jgi:uncharacterized membrane protein
MAGVRVASRQTGFKAMIETRLQSLESGHIILSPNLSARWQTNVRFLYIAVFFALVIGFGFASVGLWLVLPFTGLEIAALVSLIYYVAHKCHRIEVIYFDTHRIRVERGYRSPKSRWTSDKFWTRLIIGKPTLGHPLRLFLRGRDEQIEIGAFLNNNDKQKLLDELRQHIHVI